MKPKKEPINYIIKALYRADQLQRMISTRKTHLYKKDLNAIPINDILINQYYKKLDSLIIPVYASNDNM